MTSPKGPSCEVTLLISSGLPPKVLQNDSVLCRVLLATVTSAIPLAGGAYPLSASLTPDGTLLYIAASDGLVHALDTVAGGDIAQVSFLTNLCSSTSVTCVAGLVAARP